MELILFSRSLTNLLNNADSSSWLLRTPINTVSQTVVATFAMSLYLLTISHLFLQPYSVMAVEGYVSSVSKRHFLDQAVANGRVTSWLYISLSLCVAGGQFTEQGHKSDESSPCFFLGMISHKWSPSNLAQTWSWNIKSSWTITGLAIIQCNQWSCAWDHAWPSFQLV